MRTFDGIRTAYNAIADRIAAVRRGSTFACGDCKRNAQCGSPPDDDCVVKAEQIAREGEPRRMEPNAYYKAVWPR